MRIAPGSPVHLTYCTNIHPATGWDAVYANLQRYAPALKARLSPDAPFGIGLRLSAAEARELLSGDRLPAFHAFLASEGLYVAIINGFPYGPFHATVVKEHVYAPDWREEARVEYTLDLLRILTALLPAAPGGVDGGISTAPLSYKAWVSAADDDAWGRMTGNVVRVVEALVRAREETGALVHLDIEPEPDCLLENTDEAIAFFERWLLPAGARRLAAALNVTEDDARALLLQHVRLCFDCCHFAVEYEDPAAALDQLDRAGIRIGRVQLSSALDVALPGDAVRYAETASRLRMFADATYLHQVVERQGLELHRYRDLGPALDRSEPTGDRQWRIHFHVPLFTRAYESFGSTQDYVSRVIDLVLRRQLTRHLEIETYTWDVLPPGLKLDLLESIAREYEWVLKRTGSS